jgi:hypothetical protein
MIAFLPFCAGHSLSPNDKPWFKGRRGGSGELLACQRWIKTIPEPNSCENHSFSVSFPRFACQGLLAKVP